MKFKYLPPKKINLLPKEAGVYCFFGKNILYIGKAINLRERVKNHFSQPTYKDNLFLKKTRKIGYIKSASEIDALILETNLIKKIKPKFNVVWRDDKNYFFIGVTKEDFPKIFITHQLKLKQKRQIEYFGPFVDGTSLKSALKTLRKIFPYRTCGVLPRKYCLFFPLGLCPAPCVGKSKKRDYKKNVMSLMGVFKNRKKSVLKSLRKEMLDFVRYQEFEKAAIIRNKIFSLEKVFKRPAWLNKNPKENEWKKAEKEIKSILQITGRIKILETYDISNIQGQQSTGSMVSFLNGKPDKNRYRKFKIKISGKPNDAAMIKEILKRRFSHPEWEFPNIILIDGGKPQLSAALKIKLETKEARTIKFLAIAKRKNELYLENKKNPIPLSSLSRETFNVILQSRDEAHRFAISYHKKLRNKQMLEG